MDAGAFGSRVGAAAFAVGLGLAVAANPGVAIADESEAGSSSQGSDTTSTPESTASTSTLTESDSDTDEDDAESLTDAEATAEAELNAEVSANDLAALELEDVESVWADGMEAEPDAEVTLDEVTSEVEPTAGSEVVEPLAEPSPAESDEPSQSPFAGRCCS